MKGKHLIIVGPAASGKTTLLNHFKSMAAFSDCNFMDEATPEQIHDAEHSKVRHIFTLQLSSYRSLKDLFRRREQAFAFNYQIISL